LKGQASVLTMVIMTALALVISLAVWNLFMSTAAIQSEEAMTAATLAKESARLSVAALSSVKVNDTMYRFAFQFSTLDYQPITVYLLVLTSITSSPKPISFNLYEITTPLADISNDSTLILRPNTTAYTEVSESENVLIRPVRSSEYASLSLYYEGSVTLYRVFMTGDPECFVIEVPASAVSNSAQLTVLIKISDKYYQVMALPLS